MALKQKNFKPKTNPLRTRSSSFHVADTSYREEFEQLLPEENEHFAYALCTEIQDVKSIKSKFKDREFEIYRLQDEKRRMKNVQTEFLKKCHEFDQLKLQISQRDAEVQRLNDSLQSMRSDQDQKLFTFEQDAEKTQQSLRSEVSILKEANDKLEVLNTNLTNEVIKSDEQRKNSDRQLNDTLKALHEKEAEFMMLTNQLSDFEVQYNQQIDILQNDKAKSDKASRDIYQILLEMEDKLMAADELQEKMTVVQNNADVVQQKYNLSESELRSLKAKNDEKIQEYTEELEAASTQLLRQSNIINELRRHVQNHPSDIKAEESARSTAEAELARIKEKLASVEQNYHTQITGYQQEIRDMAEQNQILRREINRYVDSLNSDISSMNLMGNSSRIIN